MSLYDPESPQHQQYREYHASRPADPLEILHFAGLIQLAKTTGLRVYDRERRIGYDPAWARGGSHGE